MNRLIWRSVCISLLLIFLSSCNNTAMTTANVIYDRHNLTKSVENHWIALQADHIIKSADEAKYSRIAASSVNHVVLLVGQTPYPAFKSRLSNSIAAIKGVKRVINQVQISKPISPMQQAEDSWITAKIKSKLLLTKDVDPSKVKVITENNTVYLIGAIDRTQGNKMVSVAKSTAGVKKVVKVLQWVHISNV